MKTARQIKKRKRLFWYYVLTGLFLFFISAFASYFYFKPKIAFEIPFIENIQSQLLKEKNDTRKEDSSRRLYTSGEQESKADNSFERGASLAAAEDLIKRYMEHLQVRLLDLYMDNDGIIYADFSSDLKNNFHGDAFGEYKIISDLYKSLKANIPYFKSIKILIDGQETESFGGHIIITKPIGEMIEYVDERETNRYF